MSKLQEAIEALELIPISAILADDKAHFREALAALRSLPGPATEEEMQEILLHVYYASPTTAGDERGFRAAERRIFGE